MSDTERFNKWWEEHKEDSSFCEYCTERHSCPNAYEDNPEDTAECKQYDPLLIIDKEQVLKELSQEDAWE